MSFVTERAGALEFLRCDALTAPHGFSTRLGGVSQGALASLNLGIHRGDAPKNVLENWRRFAAAAGFVWKNLVFAHQIHTDLVRAVTAADCGQGLIFPAPDCDGLVTDDPGVALAVFSADCCTVLLQDMRLGAVGAVHAGWRGTALGVVRTAVEAMAERFGSRPADIRAAVGPCIDRCCFETRSDVPEAMLAALGPGARPAIDDHGNGTYHVDLKDLNLTWLRRAGVRRVETCPFCTACQPDRFWSHRRTGGERGSLASVIACPGR
ncbi:MAG: peptidoglycan editing factor PgeF [Oscillospiraceae bacterium]|nr:peptidoglycan editing factor PgeF [Oscillospiraceae bacterium]